MGLGKFNTAGKSTVKVTKGMSTSLASLYANFWSLKRISGSAMSGVKGSMDLIETYHYFDVAMGKIGEQSKSAWAENGYDSAEAYAKSFRDRSIELNEKMSGFTFSEDGVVSSTGTKSLGMDPDMVMQYQAQYAQMADSIGMTGEAALATSKAMTMLAGDWSSLRNLDFETSYQKMASALAGQSRAVRALGIDITQAALQQTAYNIGLTTSVTNMDQATKAQLRMITILDQSRVAWGDLANTLNTPANQWRMIQQNLVSLSRTIGGIFLPIVQKVLPYVNGLVIALQRLFQWIAKMLGVDIKDAVTSTGGLNDDILGDLGDEANYATDALDDTDKAAKKLKRTILGFDELNVLADNSDTGSSSAGTSGIGGLGGAEQALLDGALMDLLDEYEKVWNEAFKNMTSQAEEFAKKLEEIGRTIKNFIERKDFEGLGRYLASGINYILEQALNVFDSRKILGRITPVVDAITSTFNSLVSNINFSNIGSIVANGINIITGTITRLASGVDWVNLGSQLASGFNSMLAQVNWTKIGEGLTWRFRLAWGTLRGFVYNLDEKDLGRALGRIFDGAVASVSWSEVGDTIAKAFEKMWGTFRVFLSKRDRYTSLGAKFASLLNHAISVKNFEAAGEVIAKSFNRLFDVLKGFIEGTDSEGGFNWQELTDAMESGFESFVKNIKIAEAAEILNKLFKELLNAIDEAIDEEDWQAFGKDIGEAIANIDWLTHLKTAVDIIGKALGSLFVGIAEGIFGDFGEDFASGFIEGIQGIIDLNAEVIDMVATAFGHLADALNKLDPDFVKNLGYALGTFFGISVVGKGVGTLGSILFGSKIGGAVNTGTKGGLLGKIVPAFWKSGPFKTIAGIVGGAVIGDKAANKVFDNGAQFVEGGQDLFGVDEVVAATDRIKEAISSTSSVVEGLNISFDGVNTDNVSTAVDNVATALHNAGVNSTTFQELLGDNMTEAENAILGSLLKIEQGVSQEKTSINASYGEIETSLGSLIGKGSLTTEQFTALQTAMMSQEGTITTVQGWYDFLIQKFGEMNISTDGLAELFKTTFPNAVFTGTSLSSTTVSNFASSVSSKLSNSKTSVAELAKEFTNVGIASKNADKDSKDMQKKFDKWTSPISGLLSSLFIGIMGGSVKTVGDNSETSTGQVNAFNTSIEGIDKDSKGRDSLAGIKTGFEEAGTASGEASTVIDTNMGTLKTKLEGHTSELKAKGKDIGRYTVLGLKEGLDDNASKVASSMETIISRDMGGVATRLLVIASPSHLFEGYGVNTIQGLINGLNSMTSSLQMTMNSLVYYIKSPFENVTREIASSFSSLGYDISRAVGSLYEVGRGMSYSLVSGFQAYSLRLPHIGWNWTRITYGNGGWFDLPNFFVNWYAKGGIFTNPTIAGFGEKGAEAALPLTNKRTMAMVSDAIVNSGGALSNSMTRDDVIEAVSTGVAMAMGQNPQTVEVVVNSVLKTTDEKLAQSVSRGQARLNQRYNMAY